MDIFLTEHLWATASESLSCGDLYESGRLFISKLWVVSEEFFVEHLKSSDAASFICLAHRFQKQPSWGVLKRWCSQNMQQVYWRTPHDEVQFQ